MTHRYCWHFSGLGCLLWLLVMLAMAAVWAVIIALWVLWAAGVLPAAGIAAVLGERDLANRMMNTLIWDLSALSIR